jgi:hypothetical protein
MQYEIEKDNFYPIGIDMVVALISLLATIWKENNETLPYLKKCLTTSSSNIRFAAIQSISQIWQDDPDTLVLLKHYATNDKDSSIQSMSSKILIESFQDKIDDLDLLKYCQINNNSGIQIVATKSSNQGQKDRSPMLEFLYNLAKGNNREISQYQATLKAIAQDRSLTAEWWKMEIFSPHWQDEYWHETLILISGVIDVRFVAGIIDYLLEQQVDKSVFLQKETLLQRKTRGRKTALNSARRQVLNRRNEEWIEMSNLFLAANCFAEVRNKQIISSTSTHLMRRIQHEIEKGNSSPIGAELIFVLAHIWQDNHETLPYLKKCLNTSIAVVRRAVIQSISQIWRDDPDTLQMIRYHAESDGDSSTKFITVKDLTQSRQDRLEMLEFFYNIAQSNDRGINPSQAALKAIIENYPDRPELLDLLLDRSQNDPDDRVRKYAEKQLVIWRARTS